MAYQLLITTVSDFAKQPTSASSTVVSFSDEPAVSQALRMLSKAATSQISYRVVKLYLPSAEFSKE